MELMKFTITRTDEVLVSHPGLALAEALLQQSPLCLPWISDSQ
jgi:hypothetical protein